MLRITNVHVIQASVWGNKFCHLRNVSEIVDVTDPSCHSGTDDKNSV